MALIEEAKRDNREREQKYVKAIEEQENKIKSLVEETIKLTRKNSKLLDEIDYYRKKEEVRFSTELPLHTNSSYLTKVVKESHEEVQEMKEQLEEKEEEIGRLKNTLSLNSQSLKAKDEEIETIRMMSQYEKKAGDFAKENELL